MREGKEGSGTAPVKAEKQEERDFFSKVRIKRDNRNSIRPKSRLDSRHTFFDIYVNGRRTSAYIYVFKGSAFDRVQLHISGIKDQVLLTAYHKID